MENKKTNTLRNTVNRRKHKRMAWIGSLVVVLAVIGVTTIIWFAIHSTGNILDKSKETQKLEHFILPVIMFDPLTFDAPQNADPQMLLRSSLWSVLLSKDRNQFTTDDFGRVIVPKSDVDVRAARLYGPDIKLQHQTFGNEYELYYQYDEKQEAYIVPVSSQMAVYTPKILKSTHKGDLYTLEVGYIPPGNLWQTDAEGNTYEPEPDKIMLMDLKKVKDGFNILALRDGPDPQNTASQPNAAPSLPPANVMPGASSSASAASGEESAPTSEASSPEDSQPESSEASSPESSSNVKPLNTADANTPPKFGTVTASTTAPEGLYHDYEAVNVTDGDLGTAWTAETGAGKDGYLLFEADEAQLVSGVKLTNGFTRADLYEKNNQIVKAHLEFSDGSTVTMDLTDFPSDGLGTFTLDNPVATTSVKLVIDELKSGSTYDDTCITEVEFF